MTEHLLELRGLRAGYDGVAVVRDLDLYVDAGEVVALLGPNGAGKTTTLLTVSGLLPVIGGDVEVFGKSVGGRSAHRIAREGLAHVLENRSLFAQMSVVENLRVGADGSDAAIGRAFDWFPALEAIKDRPAVGW